MLQRENQTKIEYGTAGYRAHHRAIWDIVDRAYVVCAIRSCSVQRPIGLMLTASHNPAEDNGIKYVDYNGNMFDAEWEAISDRIVGCSNEEIGQVLREYQLNGSAVFIAGDTRTSGPEMVRKCVRAAEQLGPTHQLFDLGVATTPHLHFAIREMFRQNLTLLDPLSVTTGTKLIQGYYQRVTRFGALVRRVFGEGVVQERVLDGSNGVGRAEFSAISAAAAPIIHLSLLVNDKNLNEQCGSDYIKTSGKAPAGVVRAKNSCTIATNHGEQAGNRLICAFDGDCDRILYLKPDTLQLIDGDRLCLLFSSFLVYLLAVANENVTITSVVTQYSNGAAMNEMKTRGVLKVAQTGVKNMQAEAAKHPLSVWFESNGHGTIRFSEPLAQRIAQKAGATLPQNWLDLPDEQFQLEVDRLLTHPSASLSSPTPRASPYNEHFQPLSEPAAVLLLHALVALVDPFIGDAVVNMCLADSIFYSRFMLPEILLDIYQDLPSVLKSVPGQRDALTDVFIQSIQDKYSSLRIHLRASGTEDLIRIYLEGENTAEMETALNEITSALGEIK